MGKSRQQYDGGHYSRRGYSKDDLYKGPGEMLMLQQRCMMIEYVWRLHWTLTRLINPPETTMHALQNLLDTLVWTGMLCTSQLCSRPKETSPTCCVSTNATLGSRLCRWPHMACFMGHLQIRFVHLVLYMAEINVFALSLIVSGLGGYVTSMNKCSSI